MNAIKEMNLFDSSGVGEILSNAAVAELEAQLDREEEREEPILMQKTAAKTYLDYVFRD
jgi:hypothetical protein